MTTTDELDEALERRLVTAYDDRDARVPTVQPRWHDVEQRARRRANRRRAALAACAGAVLVVGALGVTWTARQAGEPATFDMATGSVPSTASASPSTAAAPLTSGLAAPASHEWYGFDTVATPQQSLWSATEVARPLRSTGARSVVELRRGEGDWRSSPGASLVLFDRPAGELVPQRAVPTAFGSRQGFLATYGVGQQAVVALDANRGVRISTTGVDLADLASLASTVQAIDGRLVLPAVLPAGFRVLSDVAVPDVATIRTLTYVYAEPDGSSLDMLGRVTIRSTDDPVEAAELILESGRPTSPRVVAGQPAQEIGAGFARWRDGRLSFSFQDLGTSFDEGRPVRTDAWLSAVRPLRPDQVQQFAVATASPTIVNGTFPYPVTPESQARIDRFFAAVPSGFVPFTGDPPSGDGVEARARSQALDAWIDLSFAASTTGPASGSTEPQVVADLGWSRSVLWHSPNGWSYQLTVSDKAAGANGGPASLTTDQMIALLRTVDGG